MGRGNETFGKKEVRAKQAKRREDKEKKRIDRKSKSRDGNSLDDMIAYVDENGQLSSTPPDLTQRVVLNADEIEIGVPKSRSEFNDDRHHGIVSFFNDSKGFGFIRDLSTRRDIFVHINALSEPVKENNKVVFDIAKGPKGLTAINVSLDKEK